MTKDSGRLLRTSAWLMLIGMVVFAGTLYALAITGMRWLVAITPIGGASLIAAWLCLVPWGLGRRNAQTEDR